MWRRGFYYCQKCYSLHSKKYLQKITVKDMAESLGLNRSYLCEKFKIDTGHAIGNFIMQTKIEEAKRMLKLSTQTIANISDYLAFSSQIYFQTDFKKLEGCTPKEFRASVQSEWRNHKKPLLLGHIEINARNWSV